MVEYLRCCSCGRVNTRERLLGRPGCTCGSMRVSTTKTTRFERIKIGIANYFMTSQGDTNGKSRNSVSDK